ncbi:hypothetical protein BCV69DRAFT_301401 [Microstroma glucosiphilum]|uniref:Uncharacterized protein n=1 Tax=Pseudomicrostroma glucosiphilum TaxID=1684307 RepID=A0A316TYF8_9BASI|nr:hypothetical protein BCV69DRAFT_301401 [Pseudomicrostroma glucosiphilum]PWN18262.1 hypothetical protein BCV69DRAFT_301401 [Pseudomicrostroma glucosiphilum]
MSHLTPPSPASPSPPHLLRRKRSSANAALTSRPSMVALRMAANSQAPAADYSGSDGSAAIGVEGALAGMNIQGAGSSIEELPSLQRLIFAHLLVSTSEDTPASSESAPPCQLSWALFQPDLLVTSSGTVYKLGRDEWTAMRDPVERLRGLVKSGQTPPPAPPPSPTGERNVSQSEALVLGKTLLGLAPPRRLYRTKTASGSESVQASWLILPPADGEMLDRTFADSTSSRKVTDLITLVVQYSAHEGAEIQADPAASLAPAPSQIEDVLKLDPQALAGQPLGSDDAEGKGEEMLRKVLELFRV